jgi:hypothetical protein
MMSIINKKGEDMIAMMMVKMREMLAKIKTMVSGVRLRFEKHAVKMAGGALVISITIFIASGALLSSMKDIEIAELRLRVMDLSGVVSLLESQGDVYRRRIENSMEAGRREVRIEAVKAGVAKWVVIDTAGSVEFRWDVQDTSSKK